MKRLVVLTLRVFSILLFSCCEGVSCELMAQTVSTDAEATPKCMMVLGYYEACPVELPDSTFNSMAGITIYRVNSTLLRRDDSFVQLLDSVILPLANERDWTLLGLEVRGGASPEGPYANNVRLANGRAANILNYINERLDHPCRAGELTVTTVPEDYSYLLWLLERDGDPAAPTLREIIERRGLADHAAIKYDMRRVDDGRFWNRLLHKYFPAVRRPRGAVLPSLPARGAENHHARAHDDAQRRADRADRGAAHAAATARAD